MNLKLTLLTIYCVLVHTFSNAQIYVNPLTGLDTNPGTSASPKQSLRGALRALTAPNTTIYIQEGDYPYSSMTNNANRNLGFGPGQNVTTGITNSNLPGTVIEGIGCVYWHNSNDNGTGAQNSIMTVEAVNGFTIRNIKFLGWQGSNASLMFINCTNVLIENCTFHQCALNSATALRFDGDASENVISGTPNLVYNINECTFQNNGNPSGQGTGQALYVRNSGTSHLPPATGSFDVNISNSHFVCNYAATGGAVYGFAQNNADEHPNLNFSSCTFSGNNASSQGGAIFGKYANLNVTNSGFCNNNANSSLSDRDGGAIQADQGSNLNVLGCVFQDNVAGRYGSAISVASNASTFSCTNSVFYSNNAGNSTANVIRTPIGGSISNCLFKDNSLTSTSGPVVDGGTIINSTFVGNAGTALAGTNVIDDHALPMGVYIDALGHAWNSINTAQGFTSTYSTLPNCSACPIAPNVSSCQANGGGIIITSSATSQVCVDLNADGTLSGGNIDITDVSGWVRPSCGASNFRYYFLIVGNDGLIKKVILADQNNDGIPNFAENPAVNTPLDLSGLIPGTFTIQGFYSATGTPPAIGTSPSVALSAQSCAELSSGVISFKTCLSLNGNVFNDANGLNDIGGGIVNGPGINLAGNLYANLLDASNNVISTVAVNPAGQYAFSVYPNTNYSVVLTTSPGTIGNGISPSLPTNWFNVGESLTTAVGNDGSADGIISVNVLLNNIENVNFGIDNAPQSTSYSTIISTPSVGVSIPFDGSMYPNINSPIASDLESGVLSISNTIQINTLPVNAVLNYNGNQVTIGQIITNFNPSLLTITLNTAGITSFSFDFSYFDPASILSSNIATYSVSWSVPLPVYFLNIEALQINNSMNIINWSVDVQLNVKEYQLYGSHDAKDFNLIARINAEARKDYTYSDNRINPYSYYYIRSVDIDGLSLDSKTVKVKSINLNNASVIAPNPVTSNFRIINGKRLGVISVISLNGVESKLIIQSNGEFNVSFLRSGVYFVKQNDKIIGRFTKL